jgi:transposase-like protein
MARSSAERWRLSGVHPRPEGAAPEVVGIFIAQQEGGWQVTGELGRQDGRLIVRSFTAQPVRLASKAALESIAESRGGKPGSIVISEHRDDITSAETPRGGVTAELLRSIPFGALLSDVFIQMELWGSPSSWSGLPEDDGSEPEDWEIGRRAKRQAREIQSLQYKVGRRPYSDDFYRGVAEDCLAIQGERLSESMNQALADRRGVAKETLRGWVKEARNRGMLAPGSSGRRGFEAGPNLHHDKRSEDGA